MEVAAQSFLADPAEMAAWRYCDFAQDLPSWAVVSELGKVMRLAYEKGDRPAVADAFMQACATAVTSPAVRDSLAAFVCTDRFKLSVAHPDDGREFVAADGRSGITNG